MNKAAIALGYILVVLGAVSMIAPFLWMAAVSFMTDSQIFSFPPGFIPHPFTFANYANIFEKLPVTRFFLNSLFVALITTFFQVLFSAMAGFAFARGSFRHKDLLFFMFLVTMMIPATGKHYSFIFSYERITPHRHISGFDFAGRIRRFWRIFDETMVQEHVIRN